MIDASHGNSGKDPDRQVIAAGEIAAQVADGNRGDRRRDARVVPGRGPPGPRRRRPLVYGQSITDACIDWDATVAVLDRLGGAVRGRGAADEDRRPRRRPDRRLDRAGRAASGSSAEVVGLRPRPGDARAGARARARSTAPPARSPRPATGAEVVFCAAPVGGAAGAGARPRSRPAGPRRVVTDVGSTKRDIVAALGADERFIGGHPLAGAETAGVENARADLFEGARWYLTPTERSSGLLYDRLQRDDRRPRRPAAGDRRRDPRPPDGDGQPPAARARQRARRPGRRAS